MYTERVYKQAVSRMINKSGERSMQCNALKYNKENLLQNFYKTASINKTLQRVRIINLDSSDDILTQTVDKLNEFHKKTVTTDRLLQINEELIIVAHGNLDEVGSANDRISYNADQLGAEIIKILPQGYRGRIYINSCNSATINHETGQSFVSRLQNYLKDNFQTYNGYVDGNTGVAVTTRSGRESVRPHRYGFD